MDSMGMRSSSYLINHLQWWVPRLWASSMEGQCDLELGELWDLSWSDHILITTRFTSAIVHHRETGYIRLASRMDLDRCREELKAVPSGLLYPPCEVSVIAWNKRATEALDWGAPMRPFLSFGSHQCPQFTEELRTMKWQKRCLEHHWGFTRNKLNQTWARAVIKVYYMVVIKVYY